MKKIPLLLILMASAVSSLAEDQGEVWRGVDLADNFGIQFEVCELRADKTVADVARLDSRLKAAWSKMGIDLSFLRLTPMYSHSMPGQPNVDYINVLMGGIDRFGAGWDAWMASSEGPKLMADAAKIADCRFKYGRGINKMADTKALDSTDNRIMTMNWCAPYKNVSYAQIKAKHDSWLAENNDSFTAAAWNIVSPRQGAGMRQGHFMHLVSFTSASALMQNENWIANGGGWRGIQDYETSYAQCEGESAWVAQYLVKSGA
jgi:hypothetical protein